MKNTIKLAVISALLMAGVAQSNAATAAAPKTNYISTVAITLTAYKQGATKPAYTIASKDVIKTLIGGYETTNLVTTIKTNSTYTTTNEVSSTNILIGTATNTSANSTNVIYTYAVTSTNSAFVTSNFTSSAKLLLLQTGTNASKFVVQDKVGKTTQLFDVSEFFTKQFTAKAGTDASGFDLLSFSFANTTNSFTVGGFATVAQAAPSKTVTNILLKSLSSTVAGTGFMPVEAATNVVLTGKLSVSSGSLQ